MEFHEWQETMKTYWTLFLSHFKLVTIGIWDLHLNYSFILDSRYFAEDALKDTFRL